MENSNNNNDGPDSLVSEWGRLLVRTLVPGLVPEPYYHGCNNNDCQTNVILEEKGKRKTPEQVEEICKKVNIGRQYLTKELIPVSGGSLTHPTAARSNKIFAAAIKIAQKIAKEDIERMTTGRCDEEFMVSCSKRSFYASITKQEAPLKLSSNLLHCSEIVVFLKDGSQQQVVSTSHTFWNEKIDKIICMVPVIKLPIRLPYVISHNGRYFTMKLDEVNLERFCQAYELMSTLLVLLLLYVSKNALCDEYSELVKSEVGVRVLPLSIDVNNTEYEDFHNNCTLTVHRGTCGNRPLREHEKISWSTKVCFLWKCDIEEHAMRVGECWIGSLKNPVTVIKDDGCTQESAIIRSPLYGSPSTAMSVGWLSVREQGMTHVNVHCTVHLCHLCDANCSKSTPPLNCQDVTPRTRDHVRVWNSTVVQDLCSPPSPPISMSAGILVYSTTTSIFLLLAGLFH